MTDCGPVILLPLLFVLKESDVSAKDYANEFMTNLRRVTNLHKVATCR